MQGLGAALVDHSLPPAHRDLGAGVRSPAPLLPSERRPDSTGVPPGGLEPLLLPRPVGELLGDHSFGPASGSSGRARRANEYAARPAVDPPTSHRSLRHFRKL